MKLAMSYLLCCVIIKILVKQTNQQEDEWIILVGALNKSG